jgi:hypothetical protein
MQEGALHVRLHDLARGASLGFVEFGAANHAKQLLRLAVQAAGSMRRGVS